MKNGFLDDDILLKSDTSKFLYNNYAKNMPIIDYHCHLNVKDIYEDRVYDSITEICLNADHYKWRMLRANGIKEEYITGSGINDLEKFKLWAGTLEKCIGHPVYQWSHLEFKRYFKYEKPVNSSNYKDVYEHCNKQLEKLSTRTLITNSHVKLLCTTDDPTDSLEYHRLLRDDDSFNVKVLPAFRPDHVLNIEHQGFSEYVKKLLGTVGLDKVNIQNIKKALVNRIAFFTEHGCKTSDHGLKYVFFKQTDEAEANRILAKAIDQETLTQDEVDSYKTYILEFLTIQYYKNNWVMQIHFGVIKDGNSQLYKKLGQDVGVDTLNTKDNAENLVGFLDSLNSQKSLPKVVLYSLNPNDNEMLVATAGCYFEEGTKSKIQCGSAWWFNDTKNGMENHLTSLSELGTLGNFIGMLTDSRSFLSYARHEYFRRILCNHIGEYIEQGLYDPTLEIAGRIVQDICFNNVNDFFAFNITK